MTFIDELGKAKGQGANQRYQKTIKKAGRQTQVSPFSYLAPVPPGQLRLQAQQQVNAAINPLLKQLNAQFTQTQRTGIADINRANAGFAQSAGQYAGQVDAADTAAITGQQILDKGINDFLASTGQHVTGAITAQQTAAGAPAQAIQATQMQTGGLATGIQGEQLGQGASTLSRMLTQKAADLNYGKLLPNVARAQGLDTTGLFTRNVAQQRATALGDVTSKVPGLVSDVYTNLYNQEVQKAITNRAFGLDLKTTNASIAAKKAAAKAGPALHLQLKSQKNADGSTTYFDYNPATGQKSGAYTVAGPTGVGGKDFQKRVDKTNDNARKLAAVLYKGITPSSSDAQVLAAILSGQSPEAATGAGKQKPVANRKAYSQVIALYDQAFPNQPNTWKLEQARLSLVAGGYAKADRSLSSPAAFASAMGYAPTRATSGAGGGGGVTKPKAKPKGPVSAPQAPASAPSERGQAAAQKALTDQAKQASQQAQATQSQAGVAADYLDSLIAARPYSNNPVPYFSIFVNAVRQKYPTIPASQARAIVRAAMDRWRFAHR